MKTRVKVLLIVLALVVIAGVCRFFLKDNDNVLPVDTSSTEPEEVVVEVDGEEISIEGDDTLSELISELD